MLPARAGSAGHNTLLTAAACQQVAQFAEIAKSQQEFKPAIF
jgi:hypothetical protein